MATVIGKTSARIDELLGNLLTKVEMSADGDVTSTTRGGTVTLIGTVGLGIFKTAIRMKHVATPTNPPSGESMVYVKSDGRLYTKTSDGVEVPVGLPTGAILQWPTTTAPEGYFSCQGGTFQSTTDPVLASILGDTFGTHVGTTYYLPDFRARSPIGIGGVAVPSLPGGYSFAPGQKHGEHRVKLTVTEMPSHNHGGNTAGGLVGPYNYRAKPTAFYGAGYGLVGSAAYQDRPMVADGDFGVFDYHSHGINSQGGDGYHENTHAVLGINFIIKR